MLVQTSDCVKQCGSYLIAPIDPKAFHEREKAAPESNLEVISAPGKVA
jgi:hypothetical protein